MEFGQTEFLGGVRTEKILLIEELREHDSLCQGSANFSYKGPKSKYFLVL